MQLLNFQISQFGNFLKYIFAPIYPWHRHVREYVNDKNQFHLQIIYVTRQVRNGVHCVRCFYLQKKTHVHVAKPDSEQKLGAKNTKCQECNHEKEKCECLCCCSISQIGCMYCILPVLGYRQIKKNFEKKLQIEFQR